MRNSKIVHALIIGIDSYDHDPGAPLRGAQGDAREWEQVARSANAAVQVLTGAGATRAAILAAFVTFVDGLRRARAVDPTATGLLVFAGKGDVVDPARGTTCLCPVDYLPRRQGIAMDTLSDVLDAAFGADPPAASLLAVLDCAFVPPLASSSKPSNRSFAAAPWTAPLASDEGLPVPAGAKRGWVPPVQDGPLAVAAGIVKKVNPFRTPPRLRYHARLITARPHFRVQEEPDAAGRWGGKLTRTALAIRGIQQLNLPIFGREIGAGNSGFIDWDVKSPNGSVIGRMLCTGAQPPTALTAREAQWWWSSGNPFPQDFALHLYDDVNYRTPITGGDVYDDIPFPTPTQGPPFQPNGFIPYRIGLNAANGTLMGHLWNEVDANGVVTRQLWSGPAGAIDNHGFFAIGQGDSLHFHRLGAQPTIDPDWRWVRTR
jgi:hypothetical protein